MGSSLSFIATKAGGVMANMDKLLLICIVLMIVGFGIALFDMHKRSYEKGVRDGYHRGRSIKGQE
jgi:hypothetical protein